MSACLLHPRLCSRSPEGRRSGAGTKWTKRRPCEEFLMADLPPRDFERCPIMFRRWKRLVQAGKQSKSSRQSIPYYNSSSRPRLACLLFLAARQLVHANPGLFVSIREAVASPNDQRRSILASSPRFLTLEARAGVWPRLRSRETPTRRER